MKTLVTKRLILRDLRLSDVKSFYAYAKKPTIGPSAGWEPHRSIEESTKILKLMIREQEVWGITLKESDIIIGTVGLHVRNFENAIENRREVGYVLDDAYWGKGLMVEAVLKVLDYGFKTLELDEITCGHKLSNTQSKRVIEKVGFKYSNEEIRDLVNQEKAKIMMYKLDKENYKELISK